MRLNRRQFNLGLMVSAATASGLPSLTQASTFPDKPLTFICPWPAGAPPTRPCALCARLRAKSWASRLPLKTRSVRPA